MQSAKAGLLLSNLGSPESPKPHHVRRYLKQFLNDPYVIYIPAPLRWFLVNVIILNTRPKKSAHAYQKIWTESGSPLVRHTHVLTEKMKQALPFPVEYGMRYGQPTVESALQKLLDQGVNHFIFLPLYPQYSYAASETAIVQFEKLIRKKAPKATYHVVEDFYEHPSYLNALADSMKEALAKIKPDLLLLSYHGVPVKQLYKTRNKKNYQEHCYQTSRSLREKLDFPEEKMMTSFQSRLAGTPWVKPYTDFVLVDLPLNGIKNLAVASPSFTADCLETLEEIKMQYHDLFLASGGEKFHYIPCLNSSDSFVSAIQDIIRPYMPNGKSL